LQDNKLNQDKLNGDLEKFINDEITNSKIWVFFGLMTACLIAAIGLVWAIPMYWRRSHERVGQTLNDMQQDWVRIIGTNSESNHE